MRVGSSHTAAVFTGNKNGRVRQKYRLHSQGGTGGGSGILLPSGGGGGGLRYIFLCQVILDFL